MNDKEYRAYLKKKKTAENYQKNRIEILERKKKYNQDVKNGVRVPEKKEKKEKPIIVVEERICNQCGAKKLLTEFNFFNIEKNIRRHYCKTCQSDNQKNYLSRKEKEKINEILNK
jgi:hypothetical protein